MGNINKAITEANKQNSDAFKLYRFSLSSNDVVFQKKENRIYLLENRIIQPVFGSTRILTSHDFGELPDDAINNMSVISEFSAKEGFDDYLKDNFLFLSHQYWKQNGNSYILNHSIFIVASPLEGHEDEEIPITLNTYIHIYNRSLWHELQHNKK